MFSEEPLACPFLNRRHGSTGFKVVLYISEAIHNGERGAMYGKRMPPFLLFLQVQRLCPDTSPYSQASRVINFFKAPVPSLPLVYHCSSGCRSFGGVSEMPLAVKWRPLDSSHTDSDRDSESRFQWHHHLLSEDTVAVCGSLFRRPNTILCYWYRLRESL